MRVFFGLLSLCLSVALVADTLQKLDIENDVNSSKEWRLERTNFYFENDIFVHTDSQYTNGVKLSNLYFIPQVDSLFLKIPFLYDKTKAHFVSFGITQQVFTPKNVTTKELVVNDRPYAGWLNFEFGLHQSSTLELNSFVFRIGVVGSASQAEATQKLVHKLIGNDEPQGWNNQLNNELGLNLTFQHKWRYITQNYDGFEGNFVPFVEANLGNIDTSAKGGILMRFGKSPIQDFGSSSIDMGGENGIPIRTNCLCPQYEPWSFTLNISLAANAVTRDIFLDGNTFLKSHSVEKENLILYGSYGFSARYEHYALDYIITRTTAHFKEENGGHNFGTILFSYLY